MKYVNLITFHFFLTNNVNVLDRYFMWILVILKVKFKPHADLVLSDKHPFQSY
jgi:hypothetical protein